MSIKASVSITEQQNNFARGLVSDGQYASLSAVVQRGLELLRVQDERDLVELAALRAFFEERAGGDFVPAEQGRQHTGAMIEQKRHDLGL